MFNRNLSHLELISIKLKVIFRQMRELKTQLFLNKKDYFTYSEVNNYIFRPITTETDRSKLQSITTVTVNEHLLSLSVIIDYYRSLTIKIDRN